MDVSVDVAGDGTGEEPEELLTVAERVDRVWGVVLEGEVNSRFAEPGWSYQEEVGRGCPTCDAPLHSLRRPYESGGRQYRYVAVVCPQCPAAYTLEDLGVKTYDKLARRTRAAGTARTARVRRRKAEGGVVGPPEPVPGPERRAPRPEWPDDLVPPADPEARRLLWCKAADPGWRPEPAALAAADDVRVIMPEGTPYDALRAALDALAVPHRSVRHWQESEQVATVNDLGGSTDLVAYAAAGASPAAGPAAFAARDAFALQWDALEPVEEETAYVPVADLVPEAWVPLLPHPTFNPAQAAAVPVVLGEREHTVVVAPTGAGKTPIGMVAALHAYAQGRKSAWLVPQRSLTDELDRDLAAWRRAGLHVVRLTGEFAVDAEAIRTADVWVATTEKFEAICRAGSLRAALAEVGCLIVDEIHLLGDPTRGPVLEALLARVREDAEQVRIVGLSATVANADEVAAWLGARLVRIAWRPTRLTWQLPVLPPTEDSWTARGAARTAEAVRLTRAVTEDDGSTLVFCGSKRGVRMTALALAGDRGVPVQGADVDDEDEVERLTTKAGVRLHYRDWPYKRDAEQAFRSRAADVLVATSTVAAGVNLPARAVVVRDTQIGLDRVEVSMVQQMFGRAGRVGAGEREGWAFLLAEGPERAQWQARLAAGYTVTSRIRDVLPDHVLAEAVQGSINSLREAESWWTRTLAFHQGHESFDPLYDAVGFLVTGGFLRRTAGENGDDLLEPTPTGMLTSRFMVSADLADGVRTALGAALVPGSADEAEDVLIAVLAATLPTLEQAPFTERAKKALMGVLRNRGLRGEEDGDLPEGEPKPVAGDLARAVLLLVANNPKLFRTRSGYVLGVPLGSMAPILEESQRYLAWLGAQGELGTVHPWAAVVASDLAQRVRWRALGPERGSGRLLWMCEQMATAPHAQRVVPQMWRAAREREIGAPDWRGTRAPTGCALSQDRYLALLADRSTGSMLELETSGVRAEVPPGAVVRVWDGAAVLAQVPDGAEPVAYPTPAGTDASAGRRGAVVFTRGDYWGGGWSRAYNGAG
ncbi:DEAD/DEAH box helicase [Streptomyces sp. NPDC087440]|uniref:DEAD/DEAH box helicase n=1 Tax=Streptomyces sp. NPDC087440 TaxID=3365790 RepID=UPI0037FF6347